MILQKSAAAFAEMRTVDFPLNLCLYESGSRLKLYCDNKMNIYLRLHDNAA
ncbi:hypothetical protein METHB2_130004 [Candidatus Methylobacter favarea]|uniref:Uncharacterized protein n=1 Tax=Candidatus Methylobacter favarea TaxID=2707345 RepID=A0A8S0WHD8_9GAMM|nr:hypothetical protein METHB2_130004 [Candidatus Methylobacter favarea]